MATITAEQEIIARKNLEEYFKRYGEFYPCEIIEFIKSSFLGRAFREDIWIDVMSQVYGATGVFDLVDNIYDMNIQEIKSDYSIDQDILEVGCGFYPAMGIKLSNMQKSGSITVMDPDVIPTSSGKITIYKEMFTKDTDVSKYQLIMGVMPCEGVIPMIESANKNELDLYIQLCGCTHFENMSPFFTPTLSSWYGYISKVMEDTIPDNRHYEMTLPDWSAYPVIKTKRKIF